MTFRGLGFHGAAFCLVGLAGPSPAFAQLATDGTAPSSTPTTTTPTPELPAGESVIAPSQPIEPTVTTTSSIVAPDLARGAPPEASGAGVLGPAPVHSSPTVEPEDQWYGWQTLTADAISIAAVATGIGLETGYIGVPGIGAYLFAAPTVHWYRGAVGRGFISFGIRFTAAALVVVGGAACVASALGGTQSGVCAVPVIGLILVPTSMAVDAAALAWEKTPDSEGTRTISPWFSAERRAGGVVWQGTF